MAAKAKKKQAKAKETPEALAKRAAEICRRLIAAYPEAKCRLNFATPFQLMVATILSAQCTDDVVNRVTADLFKRARTPEDFAAMPLGDLEAAIHSTGFYHNKSKSIKGASALLLRDFGGKMPREMEDLLKLPGVARKTANVVRAAAYDLPGLVCDTHFIRLSQRMGLTANERPEKIEQDLAALLPEKNWSAFSHAMLFHGRAVCAARKPACDRCVVSGLCPSAFQFPHFQDSTGGKGK